MIPVWPVLPHKVAEGCLLSRPAYFNTIIVCTLVQV